jgi:leader peptidase (prepilin peptidase)/N-methyltransferase
MGLGDVHIMAAVGACTGWLTPTLAFFLAPIFGLVWAVYLWLARGQRELPYGPWLAAASLAVMLFHDNILAFMRVYFLMQ